MMIIFTNVGLLKLHYFLDGRPKQILVYLLVSVNRKLQLLQVWHSDNTLLLSFGRSLKGLLLGTISSARPATQTSYLIVVVNFDHAVCFIMS